MKNVIYPGSTKGVIHSERQVQPIGKDKTFLLMGFKGEQDMMENLNFLTMRCIDTGKIMWQLATHEYDINPFGKLVKRPQVMNEQGEITTHVSYYHGFFANFRCNTPFYDKYRHHLDEYITYDEHIKTDHQPTWY